jgi:pyruvate/2-oxoglutarate dehydrogenase complex dihydrolipoamide acyltransferase (E2) component
MPIVSPDMRNVIVSKLGTEEGPYTVVRWHVSDGNVVQRDDVLCELEAGKAVVEIRSDVSGTVVVIQRKEGEEVQVGETLCSIAEGVD